MRSVAHARSSLSFSRSGVVFKIRSIVCLVDFVEIQERRCNRYIRSSKSEYFTSHTQNVAAVRGGMFLAPGSAARSQSL
jgi:hypothetical protein